MGKLNYTHECSSPSEWGLSPAPAALSEFGTGPQIVFGLLAVLGTGKRWYGSSSELCDDEDILDDP
ncbi:hypothetical protein M405DRAFT_858064 [Rhizopogon salebrosus TDB-379]|nr:hypothetical protein M405DRAFT_858064 [Rhizopogon salebrosus TDB-379]